MFLDKEELEILECFVVDLEFKEFPARSDIFL